MLKRVTDITGALLAAALLAPLLALVAILIKLDSRGPVFYRGRRMGRGLKPFHVLKFRSMTRASAVGGMITAPGDARITRIGAWLRLLKVDELPQLWNVLKGEMSLVGPRPEEVSIVERHYTEEQKRVLSVRPGMTGVGQVIFFPDMTGEVPAGADPHDFYLADQLPRKLAVDLLYVERQSFFYDLWVMLRTLYCILFKSWWLLLFRPPRELAGPLVRENVKR